MKIDRRLLMTTALVLNSKKGDEQGPVGTGFAMFDAGDWMTRIYIVTNRHVAETATNGKSDHFHVALFTQTDKAPEVNQEKRPLKMLAIPAELVADGGEAIDLAVVSLQLSEEWLEQVRIDQMFLEWNRRARKEDIVRNGWWEGTPVVSIGYPGDRAWMADFNRSGPTWPTVRSGIVARMQGWLDGSEESFVIDGASLGGQSGSSVFMEDNTEGARVQRLAGVAFARAAVDAHLQHVLPVERLEPLLVEANTKLTTWQRRTHARTA